MPNCKTQTMDSQRSNWYRLRERTIALEKNVFDITTVVTKDAAQDASQVKGESRPKVETETIASDASETKGESRPKVETETIAPKTDKIFKITVEIGGDILSGVFAKDFYTGLFPSPFLIFFRPLLLMYQS